MVIFGIIGVVCVGYCIAACYQERQDEQRAKAKKEKKKKAMAEQLKVQTSVYLAQKMRSNSISTTASLDIASRLGIRPDRNENEGPPVDR